MNGCVRLLIVITATSLVPVSVAAQPAWERVQSLRTGQTVTVHLRNGEVVKGKLQSAGAAGLSLVRKDHQEPAQINRENVVRVTRKSRARGAMWGGIVGFGVGLPIGAYAGPYIADWGNPSAGVRMKYGAGFGLFFGGIGAGIGAATGVETTVYKAPASDSLRRR